MRKTWDKYGFPFVITLLLVKVMTDEYRDHGWEGVAIMLLAALIGALVIFGLIMKYIEYKIRRSIDNDG